MSLCLPVTGRKLRRGARMVVIEIEQGGGFLECKIVRSAKERLEYLAPARYRQERENAAAIVVDNHYHDRFRHRFQEE